MQAQSTTYRQARATGRKRGRRPSSSDAQASPAPVRRVAERRGARDVPPPSSAVTENQRRCSRSAECTRTEAAAQYVLRSYRPVEHPESLFSRLEDRIKGRICHLDFKGLDHHGIIFGIYVRAKGDQDVSKALQKITAVVLMQLYPNRRITPTEYNQLREHTGEEVERLKHMVSKMKHEGRARLSLARYFGLGVVCLVGQVRDW